MRYLSVALISAVHLACGTDPCEELCLSDGYFFCTKGSHAKVDHLQRIVCVNYYLLSDETYVYSGAQLDFRPLLVADVPKHLAYNSLGQSRRRFIDPVKQYVDSLNYRGANFNWGNALDRLHSLVVNETGDRLPLTLWTDLNGSRLLDIVSRVLRAPWFRDAQAVLVPFAFTAAAQIEAGAELPFAQPSGLYEFCTTNHIWISKSLRSLRWPRPIRPAFSKSLKNSYLFCPQLLEDPWISAALLSVNLQTLEDSPDMNIEVSGQEDWFAQSVYWLNGASTFQLRNVPFYVERDSQTPSPSSKIDWLTQTGFEIAQDAVLMTFTENEELLRSNADEFSAFGRYLALLVANAVPAPMGPIPQPLLEALMGQPTSGNFARIANAFHEVIPVELLGRFMHEPRALGKALTGLHISETVAALKGNVEGLITDSGANPADLARLWDQLNDLPQKEVRGFLLRVTGLAALPLDGPRGAGAEVRIFPRGNRITTIKPLGVVRGLMVPFGSLETSDQFRAELLRFIYSHP